MKVAVIGGGAAGFFSALRAKEVHPQARVMILEKSKKVLSKVKVSGGGRCNVCNGTRSIAVLAKAYPRGEQKLKRAFRRFATEETIDWFESRGVALMTQADNCVFPVSQSSQTVIDCFMDTARRLGVAVHTGTSVSAIEPLEDGRIQLSFQREQAIDPVFDKVIVATGGSPKRSGLRWLEDLGHKIIDPVPSLFTFNMPDEPVRALMGIVVEQVTTSIQGTKLKGDGPLLITHWGMSGPAILKLSAFGARILSDMDYQFVTQVNWANIQNDNEVRTHLQQIAASQANKYLSNYRAFGLPERLWQFLLQKGEFSTQKRWNELGKKGINKLTQLLTNDTYQVRGKTTFKEEFVTCGGVSLESIDFKTMQSREVPNLYFAGEVLDIDGITGGYNFQAAWTTAYIAGECAGA